jgi:hypothetical protein
VCSPRTSGARSTHRSDAHAHHSGASLETPTYTRST